MKLRTIIVDNEPIARTWLRRLLAKHPQIKIVDEYGDGKSAIAGYRKRKPDLLFLDIQMPGMNGFDVIKKLQPKDAAAVFVTGYDNCAIRAFEVRGAGLFAQTGIVRAACGDGCAGSGLPFAARTRPRL